MENFFLMIKTFIKALVNVEVKLLSFQVTYILTFHSDRQIPIYDEIFKKDYNLKWVI